MSTKLLPTPPEIAEMERGAPDGRRMDDRSAGLRAAAREIADMLIFFPYATAERPRRQPLAAYGLIVFTAMAHVAAVLAPGPLDQVLQRWGYVPDAGMPLTIFSSMFLHAGLGHLVSNLWLLFLAGPLVESRIGHIPFLLFYLAGGLAAFGVSGGFSVGDGRLVAHVGASGALAAVIGAFVALYPFGDIKIWYFFFFIIRGFYIGTVRVASSLIFGLWFLFQALSAGYELHLGVSLSETDVFAHAGGFLFGLVAALLAFGREGVRRETSY